MLLLIWIPTEDTVSRLPVGNKWDSWHSPIAPVDFTDMFRPRAESSERFQGHRSKNHIYTTACIWWQSPDPSLRASVTSTIIPLVASLHPISFLPSKHQSLKTMTSKILSTWKLYNVAKCCPTTNQYIWPQPWWFGFVKAAGLRSEVRQAGLSFPYHSFPKEDGSPFSDTIKLS